MHASSNRPHAARLVLPCLLGLWGLSGAMGCDSSKVNDFDCESIWYDRKGEVIEQETREYLQVDGEQIAANRCKEDMLDAVPKGGKRAECQCVGRKAVAP